jgi:DEAD/DEAH box helicase domain-containing protein
MVEALDIENRKCLVREAEVNYFTDGLVKTDIKILTEDERYAIGEGAGELVLGDVLVRSQVSKFKKIRFHTHENIGYGEIDLGEEEMQTRCLTLLFPPDSAGGRALSALDPQQAAVVLSGTGAMIRNIAPIFLLCDPRDLGLACRVKDPHFAAPAINIYDKYPGGTGLAESLSHKTGELLHSVYQAIQGCRCKSGCPSCVGPEGDKALTGELLKAVVE